MITKIMVVWFYETDSPVCRSEMGVTVGAAKGENIGLRCAVDSSPTALR
jgi:hypothetical protein